MRLPAKRRAELTSLWTEIATVLTVFTLAIVSPGPNFLLVLNRTMVNSRRVGIFTALGVATGSGLFALAGILGLIFLISTLPHFAIISRFVGGGYLAWMGIGMLRSALISKTNDHPEIAAATNSIPPLQAYRTGLFTNLTNPKAWAFYLSLFILVVSPSIPYWGKILLTFAMFLISFFWYAAVAILISNNLVRPVFLRGQVLIQGGTALLLIWLGGSLFLLY